MQLVAQHLSHIMPSCPFPADWAESLNAAMDRFGISRSKDRMAMFLAQCAQESEELTVLTERLNYSDVRLHEVWPARFPTVMLAEPYAHNPEKLADHVYADRCGNGDEASGDGYRFRGRGIIMVTFRRNYAMAGKALDMPLVDCPDSVSTTGIAALVSAWFWTFHGLNPIADDLPNDNQDADFTAVTRVVNGGLTGLEQRKRYWVKAKQVLGIA